MRKPNLFILGVQKCGTTTLAEILASHPEVFVPSVKETYFFCDESKFARGVDWYLNEFYAAKKATQAEFFTDATPFYLASPEALQRIAAFSSPDTRFIVILRDPVKRAYSAYWYQKRLDTEPLSFGEALDAEAGRIAQARSARGRWWRHAYVEVGRYATHLTHAIDILGRERLLVLTEQALIDTDRTAARISEHVGLRTPLAWPQHHANPASMPRFRWLQHAVNRDSWLKRLLQSVTPREARSALGTRILNANSRRFDYPPVSPEEQQRLTATFAPEIEALDGLGIVEPWCTSDLAQWSADSGKSHLS